MTSVPVEIQTRRMRKSLLGEAATCLHKIPFYLDPDRTWHDGIHTAVGTAYHRGLEVKYRGLVEGEIVPLVHMVSEAVDTFQEILANADTFDWTYQVEGYRSKLEVFDEPQALGLITEYLTRYEEEKHGWPAPQYKPIWIEQDFDIDWLPGWTMSGTVDLAVQEQTSGLVVVVDHKTSKKKWRSNKGKAYSDAQVAWYLEAFRRSTGWTGDLGFAFDVIARDGTFERRYEPRTDEQIELTVRKARDVAQLIDNGGPFIPSTDSPLCHPNYCDYWKECPFGEILHQ